MPKHAGTNRSSIKNRRVFTREEFVAELMCRVDDVTDIGPAMSFVESVLRLQNDMGRPVYVFEVSGGITADDIALIDESMHAMGVACVLLPKRKIEYIGEVDGGSFGVRGLMEDVIGLKEGVIEYGQNDGFRTDGK